MNNILIIEDDNALAAGLVRALSSEKTAAESCNCLQAARKIGICETLNSKL